MFSFFLFFLQETARLIAEVSRECKLDMDPDAYVESFRPFLMDIMYSWSKGASFAEICGITGAEHGLCSFMFVAIQVRSMGDVPDLASRNCKAKI